MNNFVSNFNVLVIEYCDLRFICILVLVIWDLNCFGACVLEFYLRSLKQFLKY